MRQLKITKQVTNRETASSGQIPSRNWKGRSDHGRGRGGTGAKDQGRRPDRLRKVDQSQPPFCCLCCQTVSKPRLDLARLDQRGKLWA